MELKIKKGDLFKVDRKYYLAHCIAADYGMKKGIATQFQKIFNLRGKLNRIGDKKYPDCIFTNDRVFNLVTKQKSFYKPNYENFIKSLELMKQQIIENEIKFLAIPKIGCGLDGLNWNKVQDIIKEIFNDVDIEILVKYL